jgi:hypothetical protein
MDENTRNSQKYAKPSSTRMEQLAAPSMASTFAKTQQLFTTEPLKIHKYTIDSSVFSGMPPFKIPKVNNFLGPSLNSNNRSNTVKYPTSFLQSPRRPSPETQEPQQTQYKFAPYLGSGGGSGSSAKLPANVTPNNFRTTPSMSGSMGFLNMKAPVNEESDKTRFNGYNVAFRPFTVPTKPSAKQGSTLAAF